VVAPTKITCKFFKMLVLKCPYSNSIHAGKASNYQIRAINYALCRPGVPLNQAGANYSRNTVEIGDQFGRGPKSFVEQGNHLVGLAEPDLDNQMTIRS
jgi:hypothetical protein